MMQSRVGTQVSWFGVLLHEVLMKGLKGLNNYHVLVLGLTMDQPR